MSTTGEKRESGSLIKSILFILVFLSLTASLAYYLYGEYKHTSRPTTTPGQSDNGNQLEISVRPATPADYAYYLEVYPDLEIDSPPADEVTWNKRDLPGTTIITQGTQSVGYIWAQKYEELYYLTYLIVGREHRRKGIGTKALRHVKNQAKQLGYSKWMLDCDVTHQIPYKMYIKAGLSKVGELWHLKAPYTNPSLRQKTNMSVMVVYDQDRWSALEEKYGMIKGRIRLAFSGGILPVLLVDSTGQEHGFVMFLPPKFLVSNLVVDNSHHLLQFIDLLQDLKTPDANPEWIHFWIAEGRTYSDLVLSTIPGAVVCEQFDRLSGSTSD